VSPSRTDAAYFTQLAAWGYPLSDVERIVTGIDNPTGADNADPEQEVADGGED
jgi:ParB family chromosome partitioning protein